MMISRWSVFAWIAVGALAVTAEAAPKHHAVAHVRGTASLHHAVAHTVVGRGRGRASLRTVSVRGVPTRHAVLEHATAESRRLSASFIASATLRPMAQQLLTSRT